MKSTPVGSFTSRNLDVAPKAFNPMEARAQRIGQANSFLSKGGVGKTLLGLAQLGIIWIGLKMIVTGKNQIPFMKNK